MPFSIAKTYLRSGGSLSRMIKPALERLDERISCFPSSGMLWNSLMGFRHVTPLIRAHASSAPKPV